jgi:SAM-dependent methyltransferase
VVRKALAALPAPAPGACVADLACGEGAWLVEAVARWPGVRPLGIDVDARAVAVAAERAAGEWRVGDGLSAPLDADLVVGNPPWGAGRGPHVRRGAESASAFVRRAIEVLRPGGRLCLLVPEAWLEVTAHQPARARLLETCVVERVERLGNIFPGVFAPAALLVARRDPAAPRQRDPFAPALDREARALLAKLERTERLAGRVTFILGVVTGANRRALGADGEPIIVGKDVAPFAIRAPSRRLALPLERVQQAAPRAAYARRKVVYRFIARHPVAAVDDEGRLTLNSANGLAVDDPELDPAFVAAVMNSSPARFSHAARVRTPRILRAHLERLPLPRATAAEQRAIARIGADGDAARADERVMDLFGLSERERALARASWQR